MFSANRILILSNQLYLKRIRVSRQDFLYAKWDRLKEDKNWFENIWFGVLKKAFVLSDCRIPESSISQVRIDKSVWYLACKAPSQSNFKILRSAISQELQGHSAWVFSCWYRMIEWR